MHTGDILPHFLVPLKSLAAGKPTLSFRKCIQVGTVKFTIPAKNSHLSGGDCFLKQDIFLTMLHLICRSIKCTCSQAKHVVEKKHIATQMHLILLAYYSILLSPSCCSASHSAPAKRVPSYVQYTVHTRTLHTVIIMLHADKEKR